MTRTYQQLSAEERGVAMGMKLQACRMRAIARALHRSPSTISRELRRNGWQIQAVKGKANASAVGTLVCRRSLFAMVIKPGGGHGSGRAGGLCAGVRAAAARAAPDADVRPGKEMALHRKLAETTRLRVYFCDPHSPWQPGLNENTNGLLRQYLPKGNDLSVHLKAEIHRVAWEVNIRPRKTLGWRSAAEVFFDNIDLRNAGLIPTVALGV